MTQRIYVTEAGLAKLKESFDKVTLELKAIRSEKSLAYTSSGDTWHDNPYFNKLEQDEAAKVQEIVELQSVISRAELYNPAVRNVSQVRIGSIVRLSRFYEKQQELVEEVWEIAGYGETDPAARKLAYDTPIAKAIIGLSKGDTKSTKTPKGPVEYEIVELYPDWDSVPAS